MSRHVADAVAVAFRNKGPGWHARAVEDPTGRSHVDRRTSCRRVERTAGNEGPVRMEPVEPASQPEDEPVDAEGVIRRSRARADARAGETEAGLARITGGAVDAVGVTSAGARRRTRGDFELVREAALRPVGEVGRQGEGVAGRGIEAANDEAQGPVDLGGG